MDAINTEAENSENSAPAGVFITIAVPEVPKILLMGRTFAGVGFGFILLGLLSLN